MSEVKKIIPCKVGKGNRPKIEEVISACLSGDLHDTAMDFAIWMRENNLQFKIYTSSTRSHTAGYGDMAICRTYILSEDDLKHNNWLKTDAPQYFGITIFLRDIDNYKNANIAEELHNFIWDNMQRCGQCNSKCPCIGGRTVTIFDREMNRICHLHNVKIINPDEAVVKSMKKLITFEKKARDIKK